MGKNNQKKEKALRNLENARKYRKKPVGRGRGPGRGPRPPQAGGVAGENKAPAAESAPVATPQD